MEIENFGQDLSSKFDAWNKGNPTKEQIAELGKAIQFAAANGIDLVVKMPKNTVHKKSGTKAIKLEDAIKFSSGTDEENIIFEIPSNMNIRDRGHSKQIKLGVKEEYLSLGTVIQMRNEKTGDGMFAAFVPGELLSIGVK